MREQLTRFFILCDQRTFSYHDTIQLAASRLIINCYFVKIAAVILSVINGNTGFSEMAGKTRIQLGLTELYLYLRC